MNPISKINTIMVVVDPTVDRDFVVNRAKMIAKSTQAKVEFYINNANSLTEHSYIYEGIDGEFFETQRRLFEQHFRQVLTELEVEFKAENIAVNCSFTERHHLAEAIIKQAEKIRPDLVLKSTHHHSLIERSLVSNTDWRLIRKCPVPLLLVKPVPWKEDGSIVTAVDPLHNKAAQTTLDHHLIGSAELLASQLDQTPRIFHSYFPFVSSMLPMGGENPDHMANIRQLHETKLMELLEEHNIAEENVQLSQGDLVPTLITYLESVDANALVIGALSRNVIERAIVGNTAEKILEDCPCDVLVLKAGENAS